MMPIAEVVSLERESLYKAATAALGTAATYLWGGFDAVFLALVTLACLDYLTGWASAWVGGRLSSDVGRRGIARKVGMFVVEAEAPDSDAVAEVNGSADGAMPNGGLYA